MMTTRRTFSAPARQTFALDNDALMKAAPSIFAVTPWEGMSTRYKLAPTIEVVEMLRGNGYLPVKAMQSRARTPGKSEYTKHLIRFRPADLLTGDLATGELFPEVVMVNSHDGTSAYKFMTGLFRLVCGNGMIVQSEDTGSISVRHSGGQDFEQRIIDVSYEVLDHAPRALEQVKTFQQIQLSPPQREIFAAAAHELTDNESIEPPQLLHARRQADIGPDLWKTSNVVQENLTQGGLRGRSPSGRKYTSRAVKSVSEDVRINRALWTLTERMASSPALDPLPARSLPRDRADDAQSRERRRSRNKGAREC